jgi:hypothetical protein
MLQYLKEIQRPPVQVFYVYVFILAIMIITFGLQMLMPDAVSPKFYWLTCTALMVVYSVFNSIASLAIKDDKNYFRDSVYSFAALAIVAGYTAYLFSGLPIFEAGSYSWLFKVVFFVYLTFMSMVRFMKFIVEFAQKEEWNSPKARKK